MTRFRALLPSLWRRVWPVAVFAALAVVGIWWGGCGLLLLVEAMA